MHVVRSVAELRAVIGEARRNGQRIGLVPTMGSSTTATSRSCAGPSSVCDLVVVSIFVNPTQFDDAADLAAYPRDEARATSR